MVYILAKSIFQLNNYNIYDAVLKIIGSSIIIVVLYFIGKISEKKIADKLQFIEKKYIALFLFVLIVDSTIVSILGDFVLNVYVSKNQFLFEFFYILVVVGIFFQLALVVALILSRNAYREKEVYIPTGELHLHAHLEPVSRKV